MMYICGKGVVYMLDRSNTVFSVLNLQFPCAAGIGQSLEETLVDGVIICMQKNTPRACNCERSEFY